MHSKNILSLSQLQQLQFATESIR